MSSLDRILIAFLMLTSLLIAPAMLVSSPYRGGPGLAVIPPWANIDQTLANAGLREIAPYRAPFGILVEASAHADLSELRANGVWTLFDGTLIASICGVENA